MKDKILSVHVKRDQARERERKIQTALDTVQSSAGGSFERLAATKVLDQYSVPYAARGVRVDTVVGGLLHIVRATANRGH